MPDSSNLGLIHIYCGNGKGKTTCGMGLCVRAAGFGFRVLIYQFMKNNSTSERTAMAHIENITFLPGLEQEKFSFRMSEEEKEEHRRFYATQLQHIAEMVKDGAFDVLFLDEAVYCVRNGLLEEAALLDFLKNKPEHLEVILTGQDPSPALIECADYVSEIRKVKHPFDKGVRARKGIER